MTTASGYGQAHRAAGTDERSAEEQARAARCPRRSTGLCVPRAQVRVDVDVAHPE